MPKCQIEWELVQVSHDNIYDIQCTITNMQPSGREEISKHHIGQVFEMEYTNPLVKIDEPIGVEALVKIIVLIQRHKNFGIPA